MDYSEKAINLAKSIAERKNLKLQYRVTDVLDINEKNLEKFDIAIDKGTYDAISLCPDDSKSKRYLYKEYLRKMLKKNSIFIITSCNWTCQELQDFFNQKDGIIFIF